MEVVKDESGNSDAVVDPKENKKEEILKDDMTENEKIVNQENVDETVKETEVNLENRDEGKDKETEKNPEESTFMIDRNGDRHKVEKLENESSEDEKDDEKIINKINESKTGAQTLAFERSLVADYRSASESDTCDSESDSTSDDSESETESETDSDSGSTEQPKKPKKDKKQKEFTLADLPPIEDLKISVPEDECEEIGVITNIVDTLVVVESYKGTAPLDLDSILFLDKGKRTLGKVFDVIGPVSEPVYTVRFTNVDQMKRNEVEKGLKVFCAPRTEHSSYVFLPDLMKMKGSDASWKDNMEPPPECQDFSDDEEEQKHRGNYRSVRNENNRRRNPDQNPLDPNKKIKTWNNHTNARPPGKYINPSRFQNSHQCPRPVNNFTASSSWAYQQPAQPGQPSPSFTPFQPNPFARPTNPIYATAPPFGTFRFPNVPPFPPGNFIFNATPPPPPPPPPVSTVQTPIISYPTRTTGPPPFSSFVTPTAGNRMPPVQPFPFNAGFAQHPNFYPQMQFNNNAPGVQNTQRLPTTMARTFGSDIRGPPPPPPSM